MLFDHAVSRLQQAASPIRNLHHVPVDFVEHFQSFVVGLEVGVARARATELHRRREERVVGIIFRVVHHSAYGPSRDRPLVRARVRK